MFRAWFAITRLDECDAIIGAEPVHLADDILAKGGEAVVATVSVDESAQLLFS
jgi:hypothetical protein